jgi:NAD(P)-dependent dehydrogenase (short-subunit alcohol dehydrogenase family)
MVEGAINSPSENEATSSVLPAGKVALVTGAGSGIGRASALAFARQGACVIVADILADPAEETVKMIRDMGGNAVPVKADVSKPEEVRALLQKTIELFGRLDFAHNNAGIEGERNPTAACSEENWDRTIAVNLKGVWLCMKYEIQQMLKQGGGAIVNTASVAGLVGVYKLPAYAASKHGIVGLTKTAALEYARAEIRINAVCPGLIDTEMIERTLERGFSKKRLVHKVPLLGVLVDSMERRAVRSFLNRSIPIRRMGSAEEVANVVIWLCSDAASYVNGHALTVDGGYVAQ